MVLTNALFKFLLVVSSLVFGSKQIRLRRRQLAFKPHSDIRGKSLRNSYMISQIQSYQYKGSNQGKQHNDNEQENSNTKAEKEFKTEFPTAIFQNRGIQIRLKLRARRGDPEPTLKSEHLSIVEPEGNFSSEPQAEPRMWPEPEPDWNTAKQLWREAWPTHVYGFCTILLILATISLLELMRNHLKSRRKTALKISLLLMIFLFCVTRAVALLIDPYGSTGKVNPILVRLLFSIGQPCVISAMSLLLMVLIDTTKMNIAPPTFQRVQTIIAFVLLHVILVLITDIVVAYYLQTKILILICQIYYLVMGFILTIGYATVGYKISKNSSASVNRDVKMDKLKVLIIVASITGLTMVILSIYGAAGVFGIYSDVMVVEAWPWWSFQTIGRGVEVVMVIILLLMNINVTGSSSSVHEVFRNCLRKICTNKVETSQKSHVSSLVYSNSWLA